MSATPTPLSFTKLIVDDLEAMASFYTDVYGLKQIERIQSAVGKDAIDEILLGFEGEHTGGLVLLKFVDKPPPETGELILGFTTSDIDGLYDRVRAAGGGIHAAVKRDPGSPYQVGFVTDPEGHLAELVQAADS
jgi:predicted enzyme related to lactoylglutathione lyase